MAVKTITLTEALAELKLLDKKIDKRTRELRNKYLIDFKRGKNQVLELTKKTEEELKKEAQSHLDSLFALINNRKKLKSAIAQKNAVTKVSINGKEYTIVEAIERKNNITLEIDVLNYLAHQLNFIKERVDSINENAYDEVDRLLEAKLSNENKNQSSEEIERLRNILLEGKLASIYDPLKLEELIEKLNDDIEEFRRQVDVALSIVNAKTEIEIDFDEE